MSHKPTPYSPNFPTTQGYEDVKLNEDYSGQDGGHPPAGNPVQPPSSQPPMPPPNAQSIPMVGMQPGYQPSSQPGKQPSNAPGYPRAGPIMQQPGPQAPGGWMSVPQRLSNCPPGLEYLSMVDKLIVDQKKQMLDMIGFETNNKYAVLNSVGQKVYYAVEDTDCCTRGCCGSNRPFDIKIFDSFRNEVIHLNRPLACNSCFCPCWLQSMEVSSPPGTIIGTIEQVWSFCVSRFVIKNALGDIVLLIKGSLGDMKFSVYSSDGKTKLGEIKSEWTDIMRELFTNADMFGICFPMNLDVKMKAVLLGACFLIDFMFFEN